MASSSCRSLPGSGSTPPPETVRDTREAGLFEAVEAGSEYIGNDQTALSELVNYLPEDLPVAA